MARTLGELDAALTAIEAHVLDLQRIVRAKVVQGSHIDAGLTESADRLDREVDEKDATTEKRAR